MLPPPPSSTPFPYTTLFRSAGVTARSSSQRQKLSGSSGHADMRCAGTFKRWVGSLVPYAAPVPGRPDESIDRKSTRLNSSHQIISYAVFCLKKKKTIKRRED